MIDKHQFMRMVSENVCSGECTKEDIVRKFVLIVKRTLGTDAVGLRLREGYDFPYYTTIGFTEEFVKAEMFLCRRGACQTGTDGQPPLECVCGRVLQGQVDLAEAYATRHGGVCTPGSTRLLASLSDEQKKNMLLRGRCNAEGYESIMLQPITWGEKVIGLLQANDKRPNAFPAEAVDAIGDACLAVGECLGNLLVMEEDVKKQMRETQVRLEEQVAEVARLIASLEGPRRDGGASR